MHKICVHNELILIISIGNNQTVVLTYEKPTWFCDCRIRFRLFFEAHSRTENIIEVGERILDEDVIIANS